MHTTKSRLVQHAHWLVLFVCVVGFLALAGIVLSKPSLRLDVAVDQLLSSCLPSDIARPFAIGITHLAGTIAMVALAIILLVLIKNKRIGASIAFNIALAALINLLLKSIFQRPRPEGLWLVDASGYSFPSGHSMAAMACYGYLIYLVFRYVDNKTYRIILTVGLSVLIVLVGLSRIYLGVHYASDVLGGFLVSLAYLIVYTNVVKRFLPAGRH